ncbi:MAG: tRNA epoxyqueuosine(34) reductase QueG [Clostridiales bacterium]|nr:tRNA epoxyqueuosine(34) reductase QueG [Clostridiales bacterium]
MNNKEKIIDYSLSLGFHQIGFGKVVKFENLKKIYEKRIFLEFENPNIEKHINPEEHFIDGKTFITVALSYDLDKKIKLDENQVKVASSMNPDYHIVMREKLNQLLLFTCELLKCNGKTFVDTEGLNDREVAFTSGIGFYGKSSHIISPYLGSNFNIGYLIVDKSLEASILINNDCKDCNICVDACPTGAILGDYRVEAHKCLSYLTQKKHISYNESAMIRDTVYGCDICQRVCPYNHVAGNGSENIFKIDDMLKLSNKKFKEMFRERDFSWRGYSIIKRNIQLNIKNR